MLIYSLCHNEVRLYSRKSKFIFSLLLHIEKISVFVMSDVFNTLMVFYGELFLISYMKCYTTLQKNLEPAELCK